MDASLIGNGLISNIEFDYLNNVTSNIQTQINNLQTQIDDIPSSSTLVNCLPYNTVEFMGNALSSPGTWYDISYNWTPTSSGSVLGVGIYILNLMVTAGSMNELIKLRSSIMVRNSSGTIIDESYQSGIYLETQTSNEPIYHLNIQLIYNSTVTTNYATVYTELHCKAGTGCYCVGRLQVCKIN